MAKNEKLQNSSIAKYSLSERLKYLRERKNMTQNEIAKKAGISQSTVAQIESGKKDPSLSTVKKIAIALDVHIAILFANDDVHVFDLIRLKKKYNHVDKLNPTLYYALGKVVAYAKSIGFL